MAGNIGIFDLAKSAGIRHIVPNMITILKKAETPMHPKISFARIGRFALLSSIIIFFLFGGISCSQRIPRHKLPQPILPDYPEIESMYWEAWELLNEHVHKGTRQNRFAKRYLHSGEEGIINQWRTISMVLFAAYGWNYFPVMESLDNFYERQRPDGYISRIFLETTGEGAQSVTLKEPMVHPPLFSWAELQYYRISGDSERLAKVFPVLEKYFDWLDKNCRARDDAAPLYYNSVFGSGMSNLPRGNFEYGAWVDMSAQMAAFARDLSIMAQILGEEPKVRLYEEEYGEISAQVQELLWDTDLTFYYDMNRDSRYYYEKTVAGIWPLYAGIPDQDDAQSLVAHLKDTTEFCRPHMFPSVAADETDYNPAGFSWRGGVWGIVNYMIIQGLHHYQEDTFAREAAWNHVSQMAQIYADAIQDSTLLDPGYPFTDLHQIWTMYAPDRVAPGTRWDAQYYCDPGVIVFSGHGPISILIEEILGFRVDATQDRLVWSPWLMEKHGIRNLRFGDNDVTLWCDKRDGEQLPLTIHGGTNSELALEISIGDEVFSFDFPGGSIELTLLPGIEMTVRKDSGF